MSARALVVGVTGISGGNVATRLLADDWRYWGSVEILKTSTLGSKR